MNKRTKRAIFRLGLLIPTIALSIMFYPPYLFVVGVILAAAMHHSAKYVMKTIELEPWIESKWEVLHGLYGQRIGIDEATFSEELDKIGACEVETAWSDRLSDDRPILYGMKTEIHRVPFPAATGREALDEALALVPNGQRRQGDVEFQYYDRCRKESKVCLHTEYRIKYPNGDRLYVHVFIYAES